MRRLIVQILLLLLCVFMASAQPSLEFFTNKANALLQSAYGFGVTNIPVYSRTDTNVGYTSSIHYLLQSAANLYDAGTPTTDFPSVFRPQFGWNSNTLEIVGYTNVTTNFFSQFAREFRAPNYPNIGRDDNVWGIPWIIGMKNDLPAFSSYAYTTKVTASRFLLFQRSTLNGSPNTNMPPMYTNQFFTMSISNLFGIHAWNFNGAAYRNPTTGAFTNQIYVTLTNDYDFSTNLFITNGATFSNFIWPAWSGHPCGNGFIAFMLTNLTALAPSYWSEQYRQLIPFPGGVVNSNFFRTDTNQMGWPVHHWEMRITNKLAYAMIDTASGAVLDFVNLGDFGSSLPVSEALENGAVPPASPTNYWSIGNATDAPNSLMSTGMQNQIQAGQNQSAQFSLDLTGVPVSSFATIDRGPIFGSPNPASGMVFQYCYWDSANPRVHYTPGDLSSPFSGAIQFIPGPPYSTQLLTNSFGCLNPNYNSGIPADISATSSYGSFQLAFIGSTNLPYVIWESPDMLTWTPVATPNQVGSANSEQSFFEFTEPLDTNSPTRFYQIRQP